MRTLAQRAAACGTAGEPRASSLPKGREKKEELYGVEEVDFALSDDCLSTENGSKILTPKPDIREEANDFLSTFCLATRLLPLVFVASPPFFPSRAPAPPRDHDVVQIERRLLDLEPATGRVEEAPLIQRDDGHRETGVSAERGADAAAVRGGRALRFFAAQTAALMTERLCGGVGVASKPRHL
jgi:hypothetical protein